METPDNLNTPLKPVEKGIPDLQHYKGEAYYKQYTGDLLDIFYHKFYEQYSGKATEREKKEVFYEWLNEQIKNTTY